MVIVARCLLRMVTRLCLLVTLNLRFVGDGGTLVSCIRWLQLSHFEVEDSDK